MSRTISVIIPAYNSAEYISAAVDSALSQTAPPLEIIVIDDGSTDRTRAVLDPYIAGGQVRYFYQERQGPGKARNRALAEAVGEYVAFLDADDLWLPQKLERQLSLLTNPEVGLVYSDMEFFGESFRFKYFSQICPHFPRGQVFSELIKENFISTSTVLAKKELLLRSGGFLETVPIGEDYALWLASAKQTKVEYLPEALTRYRVHKQQTSRSARQTYHALRQVYGHLLERADLSQAEQKLIKRKRRLATLKFIYRSLIPAHGIEA